jgi:hypothetical protein
MARSFDVCKIIREKVEVQCSYLYFRVVSPFIVIPCWIRIWTLTLVPVPASKSRSACAQATNYEGYSRRDPSHSDA